MLTQARLLETFNYDPETGELTWAMQRGSRSDLIGEQAGWLNHKGYRCLELDGKFYSVHRLIWLHVYGEFPQDQIDHINRIKDDNRIANLRLASQPQNSANSKSRSSRSGLKGAYWDKRYGGRWCSHIGCNWKHIWLGYFATAEEAHAAYCEAARKLHGEFFYSGDEP